MRFFAILNYLLLLIFFFSCPTNAEEPKRFAVILAYFQVGDNLDPEFSISQTLFNQHIKTLEEGPYNILSLHDFLDKDISQFDPTKKNVVLTFENATEETMDIITPLLNKKSIPYTLFITPDNFSSNSAQKKLESIIEAKNVTIGFHTTEYKYFDDPAMFESSLNNSKSAMRGLLGGNAPEFFAYPYSLYKKQHRDIIDKHGFRGVLGQHSGAAKPDDEVLPRFTMTEHYALLERFQRILSVSPLQTSDEEPKETLIENEPIIVGFTLQDTSDPDALSCFLSGKGRIPYEVVSGKRIEIRPIVDPEHIRYRLNCILHEGEEGEVLKWRGFLFEVID